MARLTPSHRDAMLLWRKLDHATPLSSGLCETGDRVSQRVQIQVAPPGATIPLCLCAVMAHIQLAPAIAAVTSMRPKRPTSSCASSRTDTAIPATATARPQGIRNASALGLSRRSRMSDAQVPMYMTATAPAASASAHMKVPLSAKKYPTETNPTIGYMGV